MVLMLTNGQFVIRKDGEATRPQIKVYEDGVMIGGDYISFAVIDELTRARFKLNQIPVDGFRCINLQ